MSNHDFFTSGTFRRDMEKDGWALDESGYFVGPTYVKGYGYICIECDEERYNCGILTPYTSERYGFDFLSDAIKAIDELKVEWAKQVADSLVEEFIDDRFRCPHCGKKIDTAITISICEEHIDRLAYDWLTVWDDNMYVKEEYLACPVCKEDIQDELHKYLYKEEEDE